MISGCDTVCASIVTSPQSHANALDQSYSPHSLSPSPLAALSAGSKRTVTLSVKAFFSVVLKKEYSPGRDV